MERILQFTITATFSIILAQNTIIFQVSADTIFCPNAPSSDGYLICNGTNSADSLIGTVGQDIINGFGGNDKILGKSGNDIIFGGAGNDTIFVTKADNIDCGSGNDITTIRTTINSAAVDDNCEVIVVGK